MLESWSGIEFFPNVDISPLLLIVISPEFPLAPPLPPSVIEPLLMFSAIRPPPPPMLFAIIP